MCVKNAGSKDPKPCRGCLISQFPLCGCIAKQDTTNHNLVWRSIIHLPSIDRNRNRNCTAFRWDLCPRGTCWRITVLAASVSCPLVHSYCRGRARQRVVPPQPPGILLRVTMRQRHQPPPHQQQQHPQQSLGKKLSPSCTARNVAVCITDVIQSRRRATPATAALYPRLPQHPDNPSASPPTVLPRPVFITPST